MKVNGFNQECISLRFFFFLAEFPIHTTDQLKPGMVNLPLGMMRRWFWGRQSHHECSRFPPTT